MDKIESLLTLIKNNQNWQQILSEKPYCIKIKQSGDLYIFSYDMINSDLSLQETKASRGTILEVKWPEVKAVAYSFSKFFNFGEGLSDDIDWKSAYMREKIDGSIISLFYYGGWRFKTNNMFDLSATIQAMTISKDEPETLNCDSFQGLVDYYLSKNPINYDALDKNKTYIFELVSPRSRVVVKYPETKMYLLGARDVLTYQEFQPEELTELFNFDYPKKLAVKDLETIVDQLETLGEDKEGFVVVDKFFHRIKCKGKVYLSLHHMKGNDGQFTMKNLFAAVHDGIQDDIKGYFEETVPYIENIEYHWKSLKDNLRESLVYLNEEWKRISMEPPFTTQKKKYAAVVLPKYQWCQSAAFNLCKDISVSDCISEFMKKLDFDGFKQITGFKE
jgi:hypothetical protein